MAPLVKCLPLKSDSPSSSPGAHVKVEENRRHKVVPDFQMCQAWASTHTMVYF